MGSGAIKFVAFWRLQAPELSITERMFFHDTIRILQAWEIMKKEYEELELIRKILETEINVLPANAMEKETNQKRKNL